MGRMSCPGPGRRGARRSGRAAGGVIDHAVPRVRRWAAETLARLDAAQTRPAMPALLKTVEQPLDEESGRIIAGILAHFGTDAIPGLVPLALGSNDSARSVASEALAK